jgi:ribonuclease J
MHEHALLARSLGVPHVLEGGDGDMVLFGPGRPGVVDQIHFGRVYKDGNLFVNASDSTVGERRRLSFAGLVSIAVVLDGKGEIIGDPAFEITGLPQTSRAGKPFQDIVEDAVTNVLEGLSRQRRRDTDLVENAIDRAVRSAVNEAWGKKPTCHVHVLVV